MKKIFLWIIVLLLISIPNHIYALEISGSNAILIEMETGNVLYEESADTVLYPASTTKILNAILTLENCDLDEPVTASYEAVMNVPYDGSTATIQVGETWTVKQLLEAMLICSANEAANILAEHIGGNIESFASMMNAKAKEIGATSTNFVNANGLHDDNHETTAKDMVLIARYAMLHFPEFRSIVSMTKFSLPATPIYPKSDRIFTNTNKLLIPSSPYFYPYATGIKTGYTEKALHCIIASAKKNGVELIAAIFGAPDAGSRNNDVLTLLDYGFEIVKSERFLSEGEIIDNLKVAGASSDDLLFAVSSSNVVHTIPADKNVSDYTPEVTLETKLRAPIASGDKVGTITYHIEGNTYQYDLVALNNVESVMGNVAAIAIQTTKAIGKVIFWAVLSVIGIFIGLVFVRASIITKRQRIRSRRMRIYNSRFR